MSSRETASAEGREGPGLVTDGRGAVGARSGDPEATHDYSNRRTSLGALTAAVLALGALGGVLLVAADLSTVLRIEVAGVTRYAQPGHDRHAWALALLGILALPMAYGAALRRVRPAVVALVLIGAAALIVALVVDLPDIGDSGVFGSDYEDATASAGVGFTLELLGGAAVLAAGALGLLGRPASRGPAIE